MRYFRDVPLPDLMPIRGLYDLVVLRGHLKCPLGLCAYGLMTKITQQRSHGLSDNLRTSLRGWRRLVSDEHRDRNTRPEKGEELHRCKLGIPDVGPFGWGIIRKIARQALDRRLHARFVEGPS
jgi:hypothetical protein